ncbi:MAG: DNA translocase FtsK [Chloroflexota bacterium]|nr:DNA translocase FtsK [Chloroflexota bacterium]
MASQTRGRASSGAKDRRRDSNEEVTLPLRARLYRVRTGLRSRFPALAVSDRLRREMLGVTLVLIALISAWAIGRGERDGPIVAWWGETLIVTLGRAAPLVPLFIALWAIRAFRDEPGPVLLARHYLGGLAFTLATVGLLQLGATERDSDLGGTAGQVVETVARHTLGQLGSGLVLFGAGFVAVFLLADTDLRTFEQDLRALGPRRKHSSDGSSEKDAEDAAVGSEPEQAAKRSDAPPKPVPPRVINVPKREDRPAAKISLPTPGPTPLGEPMPLPDLGLLAYYDSVTPDAADLDGKARLIEETLASFKVEARVREINPGPAVTQFALEPGTGIKVRRITELQNDLALALAAPSMRIEAPVPGMARVGLEIPNAQVATVGLRETLESSTFTRGKQKLPIPLGRDVNGRYVVGDLTKMPHLLIAGATGSGKSVCLNGIISTFLLTRSPDDLKLLMIDPKMVELTGYNGVPHLQCPVVTEMDKVVGALRLVLREMQRRYDLFSRLGVRNLDGYRLKIEDEPNAEKLPYLVVIIDELADLMMTAPDEVETLLVRLAQLARATGIHLIIATQRPSVNVLTGLIKANVPARIAFAVSSNVDSRVVLDLPGAERLIGRGDMLYLPPDAYKPQRIQGAFIEDKDVLALVAHWHAVSPIPQYAQEWLDLPSSNEEEAGEEGEDPLMEQALEIVQKHGTASASMLQRRLRVGYNRAARLIERMEDEGVIGPADGLRGRPVLVGEE